MREWILFAAAILLILGYHRLRQGRPTAVFSVLRRRPSPIGSGREGIVRLDGRISSAVGEPLVAPVTESECVFYDVIVENSAGELVQSRRKYRGVPFYLDDGTGQALVTFDESGPLPSVSMDDDGPPRLKVAVEHDVLVAERPRLRRVLEETYVIRPGDDVPQDSRARAGRIRIGESVSVVGFARHAATPDDQRFGYRNQPLVYLVTHSEETSLFVVAKKAAGRS